MRAKQDSLTHFLLDEIEGPIWTATRHSFILPPDQRLPAIKDSLKWEYARSLATLARHLGPGPFLMGDSLTVPDIIATHCLVWAEFAQFPAPAPALAAYAASLRARPAFQRAMAQ